jgi:hypothetical protein
VTSNLFIQLHDFPAGRRTSTDQSDNILTTQILQLTSLLPTAEHFSILLRDALKAQLSSMKQLKPFLPSLYSEFLLNGAGYGPADKGKAPAHVPEGNLIGDDTDAESSPHGGINEKGAGADGEGDLRGPGGEGKGLYERGLGETFGFPGDARKMRERSKMKLWKEYFSSMSILQCEGTERDAARIWLQMVNQLTRQSMAVI